MPKPTRSRVCKTDKESAALFAPTQRLCIPIDPTEYDRILTEPVPFGRIWTVRLPHIPSCFRRRFSTAITSMISCRPPRNCRGCGCGGLKLTAPEAEGAVYSVRPLVRVAVDDRLY